LTPNDLVENKDWAGIKKLAQEASSIKV